MNLKFVQRLPNSVTNFRFGSLGSQVTLEELLRKAPENWYLEANEAQARGLVAAVL